MITKQDIQKIIAAIAYHSVKVSQLKKADGLTTDDVIQITRNNKDYQVSLGDLISLIETNLNLYKAPFTGVEDKDTFAEALMYTYSLAKDDTGEGVGYIYTNHGMTISSIAEALNYIMGILFNDIKYPSVATNTDINNIFTE